MSRPSTLITSLAACSMLACALAASPAAAQRVEIGNASTVVGEVRLTNASVSKRAVSRKQRIAWQDLIDTGKKSQLQILLLDRSSFGIGATSRIRIDRYVYDPKQGRSLSATFIKGALRFFSGRQEGDNRADIQTPAGRIGIRGTALDLLVGNETATIAENEQSVGSVPSDEDEATLVVLRGPGAGTAGGLIPGLARVEGAGVTVILDQPGLAAYIPRNGAPPIGPFRISNTALSQVQDKLAPEVARAASGGSFLNSLIPAAVGAIAVGSIIGGGDDRGDQRPSNPGQTRPQPNQNPTSRPGTNPNRPIP
jgi:hypothetical protein